MCGNRNDTMSDKPNSELTQFDHNSYVWVDCIPLEEPHTYSEMNGMCQDYVYVNWGYQSIT